LPAEIGHCIGRLFLKKNAFYYVDIFPFRDFRVLLSSGDICFKENMGTPEDGLEGHRFFSDSSS